MMEYDLNHRIYVKDDIEKLVTDAEKQWPLTFCR
jgi:hypothetical protein